MRALGGIAILAAAAALVAAPAAQAGTCPGGPGCPYVRVTTFPVGYGPSGVAGDPNGNFYAANGEANTINKYNATGALQAAFSAQGFGPGAVALNPSGSTVYVATSGSQEVNVFNSSGAQTATIGGFQNPVDVTVEANGTVDVLDTSQGAILRFNSSNQPIGTFTGARAASAIAAQPGGGLAAAGPGGPGQILQTFNGALDPGLNVPLAREAAVIGIAVDQVGDVYVLDAVSDGVYQYDSGGNLLTFFGGTGSGPGNLEAGGGITADRLGFLWAADTGNNRVSRFQLAPAAAATLRTRSARLSSRGLAALGIRCRTRRAARCHGVLDLRRGGRRLAQRRYSVRPGRHRLRVRLGPRTRRSVRRRGRLAVSAVVTSRRARHSLRRSHRVRHVLRAPRRR